MARDARHSRTQDPRWRCVGRRSGNGRVYPTWVPVDGARFGTRVVARHAKGRAFLRCDCGRGSWVTFANLQQGFDCAACARRGRVLSPAAEVLRDARLRHLWVHRYSGMVSRCTDPGHRAWPNYGGRGIRVHPEWLADRNAFLRYATTLPRWDEFGLDLDRIDNNRGYEPGNLRLVSRGESAANRRRTAWVEWRGERLPRAEFLRRACPGWHYNALLHHLARGRSADWIADHYARTRGLGSA